MFGKKVLVIGTGWKGSVGKILFFDGHVFTIQILDDENAGRVTRINYNDLVICDEITVEKAKGIHLC